MIEELRQMIKETDELAKAAHILDMSSKDNGTVLVKPRVWPNQEAARKASTDWKFREDEELRIAREAIEKKMEL